MQIFVDESGGSDPGHQAFLVAAVHVDPHAAVRIVKSFRKASGYLGEVKGRLLSSLDRRLFCDLITRDPETIAAAVVCLRGEPLGSWAFATISEPALYTRLTVEACHLAATLNPAKPGRWEILDDTILANITCDGGRYQRKVLATVRDNLAKDIELQLGTGASVVYANSHDVAGLQIADVIANSVLNYITPNTMVDVSGMIDTLVRSGRLVVEHVELGSIRPDWLAVPSLKK